MHLILRGLGPPEPTLGPAPFFRIDGRELRIASGDILGRYDGHWWQIGGDFVTAFDCDQQASVRFEGGSAQEFGPFRCVSITDGAVRGDERLLAVFTDETGHWHCLVTGTDWTAIVLSKA